MKRRTKNPARQASARRTWQSPSIRRRRVQAHLNYRARVRAGLVLLAEKEAEEAMAVSNSENR
jgi:hypothetical protein